MDLDTELVEFVNEGNVQKVFDTIYKGACLNVPVAFSDDGDNEILTTPLIQAICLKSSPKLAHSIAQILLLHGADPDLNVNGRLPLLEAVRLDRLEIVRLLLEAGVKSSAQDNKGKDALYYAQEGNFEDIISLLLGQETKVSITFNGYVFEDMENQNNKEIEKENNEIVQIEEAATPIKAKAPTDFLLEVEKIFGSDIIGTPSGATLSRQDVSPVKRDLDEVADLLQGVGFRTPRSYSKKPISVLSTKNLTEFGSPLPNQPNAGYQEKVDKYLQSIENISSFGDISTNSTKNNNDKETDTSQNITSVFTTPKVPEKSYLRPTVSSSAKKKIPKTLFGEKRKVREQKHDLTPSKRNKETVESNDLTQTKYGTYTSQKTNETGISLAISLASSNCMTYSEEYIIKDDYCGIELIEKRIPSLHSLARQDEELLRKLEEDGEVAPLETSNFTLGKFTSNPGKIIKNTCSLSDYSYGRIHTELEKFGEPPKGPVTTETRRAYLIRLRKLKLGLVVPANQLNHRFPAPLAESIRNISSITKNWETLWKLEEQMLEKFNHVDAKLAASINYLTRESVCKSSFNYLLLDPRKSQNLPFKIFSWGDQDLWKTFIDSIFYIGKGTRSRPFQHLYDAASKKKVTKKHAKKVARILDIWKTGHGVVSLQLFNNSIAVEGFTREAAMIDALGLKNLTNVKPGDYYGPAKEWDKEDQLKLGTFLLYRAFKIFLQEGERQIRPVDLKIALD